MTGPLLPAPPSDTVSRTRDNCIFKCVKGRSGFKAGRTRERVQSLAASAVVCPLTPAGVTHFCGATRSWPLGLRIVGHPTAGRLFLGHLWGGRRVDAEPVLGGRAGGQARASGSAARRLAHGPLPPRGRGAFTQAFSWVCVLAHAVSSAHGLRRLNPWGEGCWGDEVPAQADPPCPRPQCFCTQPLPMASRWSPAGSRAKP